MLQIQIFLAYHVYLSYIYLTLWKNIAFPKKIQFNLS